MKNVTKGEVNAYNYCSTINFSSHNQMKEAVEVAIQCFETLIQKLESNGK